MLIKEQLEEDHSLLTPLSRTLLLDDYFKMAFARKLRCINNANDRINKILRIPFRKSVHQGSSLIHHIPKQRE